MTSTVSFRDRSFQVVDGVTHPLYSLHCFTQEERDFRDKYWTVQPGDVVADAGAAYGSYTLTALSAGAAKVYAFEPVDDVREDLIRNLELNGWRDRCFVSVCGLWDEECEANIGDYAPHWPKNANNPWPLGSSGPARMRTLDSVPIERLDWLKIDVEGAEVRAVRGALKTIERCKPRLIIEVHVFLDPALLGKVRELLPQYTFEEIERDPCVMLVGSAT